MAGVVGQGVGHAAGAVYHWLQEDAFAHLALFFARSDGSTTVNVREIDDLLREAWGPFNHKYAEGPEPCRVAIMPKFGCHLHKIPVLASQLTGELLRKRLRAISPSSMGLNGWGLQDV